MLGSGGARLRTPTGHPLRACVNPFKLSLSLSALACESRVVTRPSRFLRASSACESQHAHGHTHIKVRWRQPMRLGTGDVHTMTAAPRGQREDSAADRHDGARSRAAPQPPGGCTWTRPGPPPTQGFCCSFPARVTERMDMDYYIFFRTARSP
jgi:hypothetical protein